MKLAAILRRSPPVEPADTGAGRWVAVLLRDRDQGAVEFASRLADLRMKARLLPEEVREPFVAELVEEANRCAPGLGREVARVLDGRPRQ